MKGMAERNLIKRLQTTVPRGAPFGLPTLATLGVSAKRASRYAESGWLVRLGQGVYAFPNDPLSRDDTLRFLQDRVPGLHVAARSALALQGVRHQLGPAVLVLWGDHRHALPRWFTERFPARYASGRLFAWPDDRLRARTVTTPPGLATGLRVAVPERAVLEMLYEVGRPQGLEEARNIFDGLRSLRSSTMGPLLACCTSVKTVRLFLAWARETRVLDVDSLLQKFELSVGSESRWVSRLADGTLLSLKPRG